MRGPDRYLRPEPLEVSRRWSLNQALDSSTTPAKWAGPGRVTGAVEIRKRGSSKADQSGPIGPAWRRVVIDQPAGGVELPRPESSRRRARAARGRSGGGRKGGLWLG